MPCKRAKTDLRQTRIPEAQFPRMGLVGNWVNRGNNSRQPLALTSLSFTVIVEVTHVHPLEVLREGQTRREAGAQSLRASSKEVAGLPNRVVGLGELLN